MLSRQKAQLKCKYLIVGDSGVGKTSLMMRYTQDQFQQEYLSTVGIDFKVKKIQTEQYRAVLNIWDTAGQERFRTITKNFYKGSQGIIIAYSITDPVSYSHIDSWISQIKNNCQDSVDIILLGCKCDLDAERKIKKEEGSKMAAKHSVKFFEVSAKTNKGIEDAFAELTTQVFRKRQEEGSNKMLQTTHDTMGKLTKEQIASSNHRRFYCC